MSFTLRTSTSDGDLPEAPLYTFDTAVAVADVSVETFLLISSERLGWTPKPDEFVIGFTADDVLEVHVAGRLLHWNVPLREAVPAARRIARDTSAEAGPVVTRDDVEMLWLDIDAIRARIVSRLERETTRRLISAGFLAPTEATRG